MDGRIVITGMGIVSPYGVGPEVLWQNLMAGETGINVLTSFDTSHLQCKVGGQCINFRPELYLNARILRKIDRFTMFGLICAQQALQDAGLLLDNQKMAWSESSQGADRVGICVGNSSGGWVLAERELRSFWCNGPRTFSPYMATAWFPGSVQGHISIQFAIKGIGRTFINDRASGASAIIHAAECLQRGKADIMLAGGTEAPFSGFAALCYEASGLMSTQAADGSTDAYCPFDDAHNGLVAGEGAAFFVMERLEDAVRRDAPILAELAGWATTHDGYDFVQPAPDGKRFAAAMTQAMARADVRAQEIDGVFAAGSAVPSEDLSETSALHQALGQSAMHIPVSTPKAAFGNLFGAALPVDMAIALLSMRERTLPATLHFSKPAPGCDLDYIPGSPRQVDHFSTCLLNARGMGGANAALLLRQCS